MRCDDYCCNHGCNQGRHCPARQACQLPEPEPDADIPQTQVIGLLTGAAIAAALVTACLLAAHMLVRAL